MMRKRKVLSALSLIEKVLLSSGLAPLQEHSVGNHCAAMPNKCGLDLTGKKVAAPNSASKTGFAKFFDKLKGNLILVKVLLFIEVKASPKRLVLNSIRRLNKSKSSYLFSIGLS